MSIVNLNRHKLPLTSSDVGELHRLRNYMAQRVFDILAKRNKDVSSFFLWCTLFDWMTLPVSRRQAPRVVINRNNFQQLALGCLHLVMVENEKFYFHEKDICEFFDPRQTDDLSLEFRPKHLRFVFDRIVKLVKFQVSPPITHDFSCAMLGIERAL